MSRHKQKKLNFYKWTSLFCLLLALISGGVLIYQWWEKRQELAKLKTESEQEIQQYELQKNHLISINSLSQNPNIHKFFTDLLQTYARKFADNQNLNISHYPLIFAGFYSDEKISQGKGEMGRCSYHSLIYPYNDKTISISVNQLYLLNKFGHERYFATHPNQDSYFYLNINFATMMKTCSHELAHYLQFVKHGRSSCKSDLKANNGKYNSLLAQEHKEFTQQIKQLIATSPEYSYWEKKWKEI